MRLYKKIISSLIVAAALSAPVLYNTEAKAAEIMKVGSSSTQVSTLQWNLKSLGYFNYDKITGYYGYITQESVMRFQKQNNLVVDGIAGPQTLAKLDSLVSSGAVHTVRSGDTLWTISLRYGTTMDKLRTLNGLKSDTIYPGQVIRVPAQSVTSVKAPLSESQNPDLYWLSRIIHAESEAEPYTGKVAVGNVVLNRKASPDFPNTVKGVIFEYYKGIPQFSPVADGTIYNTPSQDSVRAAQEALNGARPVGSSTYFFNPDKSPAPWIVNNKTYVMRIGDHVFYR